jgi:amidophosphoribosyltransferase
MENEDFRNTEGIGHECGLALVRLLKPLDFYREKYGSALYGVSKLNLLMEKQRNRGQDGAGIACVKINHKIGVPFIFRKRSSDISALQDIFNEISFQIKSMKEKDPENNQNSSWLKVRLLLKKLIYLFFLG